MNSEKKDLLYWSHINEEALVRRTRHLTEEIQEIPQACWASNKKWNSLQNDELTSNHGVKFYIEDRSRVKIVKMTLNHLACKK